MKEWEQKKASYTKKGINNKAQTEEYETKLEQIVSAVKEGFKTQNDILSNTIKGTNRGEQNKQTNQAQHIIMNQTQQTPNAQNTLINQP